MINKILNSQNGTIYMCTKYKFCLVLFSDFLNILTYITNIMSHACYILEE